MQRAQAAVRHHQALAALTDLNKIKAYIVEKLRMRVDATELMHPDGRVLVFEVPSRPVGQPLDFEGAYLMRAGEDKTVVTSQVIGAAKEAGLIKADESETTSTRYARYVPFGA